MKITFSAPSDPQSGAAVVAVLEERKLSPSAQRLDQLLGGALSRAIEHSRFRGRHAQTLEVGAPQGSGLSRVLLLGFGKAEKLKHTSLEELGGTAVAQLNSLGESEAVIFVDALEGVSIPLSEQAARLALGARLRAYRFDKYKTKEKPEKKPSLRSLDLLLEEHEAAAGAFGPLERVAEGVFLTRDVVSEPANIIYPESFVAAARALSDLGVEVYALGPQEMRDLGMGALLGVAQGSDHEARLLVMRWNGGAEGEAPLAVVGKGVTFDTGGISIKPASGMEDMKWDMGGAGTVLGLMKALAGRSAKANVVGICGLVENMPDGKAQRPGDIVTSMSGQTIEVINTDAEGRLVLADALWYVQEKFKPRAVVDLATLTGAIIISLGNEYAGLFSNDDTLSERLAAAGKSVGELLWTS
jgi:leucyl aminopeptidase